MSRANSPSSISPMHALDDRHRVPGAEEDADLALGRQRAPEPPMRGPLALLVRRLRRTPCVWMWRGSIHSLSRLTVSLLPAPSTPGDQDQHGKAALLLEVELRVEQRLPQLRFLAAVDGLVDVVLEIGGFEHGYVILPQHAALRNDPDQSYARFRHRIQYATVVLHLIDLRGCCHEKLPDWLPHSSALFGLAASAAAQAPVAIVEDVQRQGRRRRVHGLCRARKGDQARAEGADRAWLHEIVLARNDHGRNRDRRRRAKHGSSRRVQRVKVDCDASGDAALRSRGEPERRDGLSQPEARRSKLAPPPQITLYGLSPLVEVKGRGTLVIERHRRSRASDTNVTVDEQVARARQVLRLRQDQDVADAGRHLHWQVWDRTRSIFKIDPHAKPGATPIVGRLLRL